MWEPKEMKVRNKWAGLQSVQDRLASNPVIWQRSQQVVHWSWCQVWKKSEGCPFPSLWVRSEGEWYASQVGIRPEVQQNNPLTHRWWCSCSRLAKQAQGTRWQLEQVSPQATYEDCETPCSAVMCLLIKSGGDRVPVWSSGSSQWPAQCSGTAGELTIVDKISRPLPSSCQGWGAGSSSAWTTTLHPKVNQMSSC